LVSGAQGASLLPIFVIKQPKNVRTRSTGDNRMPQRYSIRAEDHERWIVSADGEDILVCSRFTVAIETVREAAHRLEQLELSGSKSAANSSPGSLPETFLDLVQRAAAKHRWRIEQHGDRFYLRSVEPCTLRRPEPIEASQPTNHLPFFRSHAEIYSFLTGE
jgi:hypothetical protein